MRPGLRMPRAMSGGVELKPLVEKRAASGFPGLSCLTFPCAAHPPGPISLTAPIGHVALGATLAHAELAPHLLWLYPPQELEVLTIDKYPHQD